MHRSSDSTRAFTRALLAGAASLALIAAAPAFAQEAVVTAAQGQGAPPPAPPARHRQVDGDKILQLLVAKGVISQADAEGIEAQASVEPAEPSAISGGVNGDIQTIPYIPAPVIAQIRDQVRTQMKSEAKAEGWASPGLIPDWLSKVTLEGDVRVREEEDLFDKGNDPNLVNFAAINAGSPYNINRNVAGSVNPPYLNSTQDRNRTRVRARFGLIARPDDWISFEIRAATGNDNSPVSANQTLGSGGDFSKYALWLDRADVRLAPQSGPLKGLQVDLGRGDNPFWSTALLFYPELNFDGFSARYRRSLTGKLEAFVTAGAFPIFNTSLNFGSNDAAPYGGSFSSRDQWLFAGQLGAEFKANDHVKLTGAVGFFDFDNVQGKLSRPCLYNQDVCSSDSGRPPFMQRGNSLFPIRNTIPDPNVAPGLSPDPQYFGLASNFRVLEIHGALDLNYDDMPPVRLEGEFVDNLAFKKALVQSRQVNVIGPYSPGGVGWLVNLTAGKSVIQRFGEWNVSAGYRYLQSDAVLDGVTDADFHLGGTNAKGYVLMGYYGIGKNTSIGARWFSSDVITGPRYSNDVLQLDLNTRF